MHLNGTKRILIVCSGFYPANSPRSFRATELAKEFARQGHFVKVITHKNAKIHNEFEIKYGIFIRDLGKRKYKPIILKGKGLNLLFRRFVRRFLKMLFEYPDIELITMVKKKLKTENACYDLLISIAVPYPVHWGVAANRSKKHSIATTWVADCGDPYVGQENDTFKVPFYFSLVEKWFMRKADYISVPTNGAIAAYFPEFHYKIKVIPQGFRFEDYQFNTSWVINPRPTFAYAGMFMPGRRDPSEFIKYLKTVNIDFEFHIYTTTPQFVTSISTDFKNRILVHDLIPREELLKILSKMDFLVNFENIGSKQTPSKLIDYIILNKPVLSIKTGNLNENLVNEFLSGNYKGQLIIENPDQYRIENVCKKFIELLD